MSNNKGMDNPEESDGKQIDPRIQAATKKLNKEKHEEWEASQASDTPTDWKRPLNNEPPIKPDDTQFVKTVDQKVANLERMSRQRKLRKEKSGSSKQEQKIYHSSGLPKDPNESEFTNQMWSEAQKARMESEGSVSEDTPKTTLEKSPTDRYGGAKTDRVDVEIDETVPEGHQYESQIKDTRGGPNTERVDVEYQEGWSGGPGVETGAKSLSQTSEKKKSGFLSGIKTAVSSLTGGGK